MKSGIAFFCLWAIAFAAAQELYGAPITNPGGPELPPPPQPTQPGPGSCPVFVCPEPPPEPVPPPPPPKEGLITSLLHFMDSINVGANTLVGKTLQEDIFEITQLVSTVGITGDVCSVLRRSKKLGEEFWTMILNTISDLAWKLEKLLVQTGIIYENQLGLILGDSSVQDDLRTIHGLLGAGQGKAVPIVLAVKAEYDKALARFDFQTRYLHTAALRSCNPQAAQQQWVGLYQQTAAALVAAMEKYYTQTQVTAVATQNQLKVIVARLLAKEVAAVTQLLS